MKGPTAFQILSLLMASDGEEWQQQQQQHQVPEASSQYPPRFDLDLCDGLGVESLEVSQELYSDDVPGNVEPWVESVIELTSSGEFTSSGDVATVPSTPSISEAQSLLRRQMAPHADDNILAFLNSDNAIFGPVNSIDSAETTTVDFSALVPALCEADESSASVLTFTPSGTETDTLLAGADSASPANLPSTLWNFDLTASTFDSPSSQAKGRVVAETLTTRHTALSSASSTDGDLSRLSLRSKSSSASSLVNLSLDDDDDDDDDDIDDQQKLMLDKREKNRLAAQKCRNKKRDRTEALQKDVSRLEQRQDKLREEVRRLQDERETLEDIMHVHGLVCPKMRKMQDQH